MQISFLAVSCGKLAALLVVATLQLIVAATCGSLCAESDSQKTICGLFAALCVFRECVGLVVDCFNGWGMELK